MEEVVSGADGLTLEDCNAEIILDSARRRRRNILYEMNMRSSSRRKRQTDEATTPMALVDMTVSAPQTAVDDLAASDAGSETLETLLGNKVVSTVGQALESGDLPIEGATVQTVVSSSNPVEQSYEAPAESPQQVDYYVTFNVMDETEVDGGEDVCAQVINSLTMSDPPPVCEVYYSDTGRLVLQVTAAPSDPDAYENVLRAAADALDVPGLDMGTTNVARIAPPTPAPDDPTTTPADEDTTGDE